MCEYENEYEKRATSLSLYVDPSLWDPNPLYPNPPHPSPLSSLDYLLSHIGFAGYSINLIRLPLVFVYEPERRTCLCGCCS
jgi:hypothetical protein